MPKWTEYTTKDTLADNDEVMLYDATGRANKRGLMSKFWDYVVDKMSTAVISKLETNNKTIIGAINALNSDNGKLLCVKKSTNESKGTLKFTYNGRLAAIALVTRNGASSLAYYIGINSGNTFSINKLGGGDIDITVDLSEKTISFPVPDWSTVLMISIGGADLK